MTRYTWALSKVVTRYVPPIALALSIASIEMLCSIMALLVVALPYALSATALATQKFKASTRIAFIILYIEIVLVVIAKHG